MEPENPPESQQSASESSDTVMRSDSKVPRWVIKAIAMFWLGWVLTDIGTGMLRDLRSFLIIVLISLFLGFAIEPAVNKLERWGIRRGLGVWIMYLVILLGIVAFSAAMGTALATQINSFIDEAPRYVEDAESWLQGNVDEDIDLSRVTEEFVDGGGAADLANRFADDVVNLGTTVVNVLFQTFTVLLFTFYIVAEGPKLRRTVCSFLPPARQRVVLSVWDLAIEKTGGYIYSRGVLAILSAAAHWIAFQALDVPFPIPLALWVGIMSQFIPVVGTYIAGALPIIISLIDSPRTGLFVLLVVIAYQQIENYLFAPRVTAQTMDIHVAVAYGSVLVGSALLGVVGALLSLPFAATLQAFISGYRQHFDVEEDALSASASRRGRRSP
ncbi:MAG: AI-2E family transporter [Actinomycetota bacterium]